MLTGRAGRITDEGLEEVLRAGRAARATTRVDPSTLQQQRNKANPERGSYEAWKQMALGNHRAFTASLQVGRGGGTDRSAVAGGVGGAVDGEEATVLAVGLSQGRLEGPSGALSAGGRAAWQDRRARKRRENKLRVKKKIRLQGQRESPFLRAVRVGPAGETAPPHSCNQTHGEAITAAGDGSAYSGY